MSKINQLIQQGKEVLSSKVNAWKAAVAATVFSVFGVTDAKAQQVIKSITDDTNATTVELFVLRNGTTPSNVIGEDWFDVNSSDSGWVVNFRSPDWSITYNATANINWSFPTLPNELIWNGNFQSSWARQSTRINFTNTVNSSDILDVSVQRTDSNADALEDGNTNIDLLKSKFILSKSPNIPTGTRAILRSRAGVDLAYWRDSPYKKRIGFQFDGNTRVCQSHDRQWTPFDIMQDTTLGIENFEINETQKMKAYPNPTLDTITLDNGDQFDNDFDFEIYDLTGKQVWSGKGKEWQAINIENLISGNYIITYEDEDGNKDSNKIIKK